VGKREVEAEAVAVRLRSGEDLGQIPVPDFLDRARSLVQSQSLSLDLEET
jgi:threonyl-tRNA synthetase